MRANLAATINHLAMYNKCVASSKNCQDTIQHVQDYAMLDTIAIKIRYATKYNEVLIIQVALAAAPDLLRGLPSAEVTYIAPRRARKTNRKLISPID